MAGNSLTTVMWLNFIDVAKGINNFEIKKYWEERG